MNKLLSHSLIFIFASLLSLSMVQAQAPQASKLDLVKVNDDIYMIQNAFVPGNITVLITDEGVLLVDNKFDVDQDNIMKLIRTVTDKPIVYVVNTHFHGDHTGGNSAMQKMHASVFAHQTAREKMIDAGMPGLPDVTLEDTLNIHLGGKTIELHYLGRGHTDGDVVAYFPDYRLLSAGDLFTYGDATPQLIDYSGGGSAKSWTTTLDRILKLDFETVIPGHGDVTTKAEMKKFRNNTVMLRQRVSELLKAEASREEMIAMLKSEFHYVDFLLNISLDGLMVELR